MGKLGQQGWTADRESHSTGAIRLGRRSQERCTKNQRKLLAQAHDRVRPQKAHHATGCLSQPGSDQNGTDALRKRLGPASSVPTGYVHAEAGGGSPMAESGQDSA